MGQTYLQGGSTTVARAPRGYAETLTGLLLDAPEHPVLLLEDGHEWRLEIAWMRWRHLLGRKVRVKGVRDGCEMIAVDSIIAAPAVDEIVPMTTRPIPHID